MGIDYYIINKTKGEYVWLGRRNPVGGWDNLNLPVTEKMLDESAMEEVLECADLILVEGRNFFRNAYYIIYTTYNKIKDYIRGNDCIVIDDAHDYSEFLDTDSYSNNIEVEDEIFEKVDVLEGFE